ncbi:hypothetical protein [Streptomyces johnsoniae]|uniref:Secreted protein n=1 Tax=Streptomyces johnsoniae TaxID=3075532 RepID=A0ABU2RY12_9ACTN|nr:hypothetical protein [Streptomyces sp. DSM 41886]MDT0441378.1 hypothetical protein [Streptomyces sp. DSM 41886]
MLPWPIAASRHPRGPLPRAGRCRALAVLLLAVVCLLAAPVTASPGAGAGAAAAAAAPAPAEGAPDRAAGTWDADRPDAVAPPRAAQGAPAELPLQPLIATPAPTLPSEFLSPAGPRRAAIPAAHPPYTAPLAGRAPPSGS